MLLVSVDSNALPHWRSKRSAITRSGTFGRSAPRHEDGCGNGEKTRLTWKELEDFKINELAKAKADFQAQAPWDTNGSVHAHEECKSQDRLRHASVHIGRRSFHCMHHACRSIVESRENSGTAVFKARLMK